MRVGLPGLWSLGVCPLSCCVKSQQVRAPAIPEIYTAPQTLESVLHKPEAHTACSH